MHSTLQAHPRLGDALEGALSIYHLGTAQHADRVRQIAIVLAADLRVRGAEREVASWAAWLHDVGKIAVPAAVLSKKEPLTKADWTEIKRHPAVGAEMLVTLSPGLAPIAAGVRAHHERWDGSGYPDGLVGEKIPLVARIVAVADTFDAMAHRRSYRKRVFTRDEATTEIEAKAGVDFDPKVVAAFGRLYREVRIPGSN
jgi:putative nucleotidyltransferase with HDIG domain